MPFTEPEAIERLIRMEAKLDSHLYRTTQNEMQLKDHDQRLRRVETGHAKTLGIAAGASAVFTLLGQWFHIGH